MCKKSRRDALLAAAYPGIPSNYLYWPDFLKEAWIANIPYTIAQLQYERLQVDLTTPERVYNAVLVRTGDVEQANKALINARMNDKIEELKRQGT